jgi:hypothetical protein
MGKFHPQYRAVIQDCFKEAKGDLEVATQLFNARVPNHGIHRLDRFIRRWAPRENTKPLKQTGRPPKMSDETAKTLLKIWHKGNVKDGHRWGYTGVDHACRASPVFNQGVLSSGIKQSRTVERSLARVNDNKPIKVHQIPKATLPTRVKEERVRFCKKYKRNPLKYFQAITWIDETSLEVHMKDCMVSADQTGRRLFVEDPFQAKNKKDRIYLRAALAVNYVAGPLVLWWHTGTTGITYDPPYQVIKHSGVWPFLSNTGVAFGQ